MSHYELIEPEQHGGFLEPKIFSAVTSVQDIIGKRLTSYLSVPIPAELSYSYTTKPIPAPDQIFEMNKNRFIKLKETLLNKKEFADKFIAIIDGNMVDSDFDRSALAERVYTKYGYVPLFIGKTSKQTRYKELPSPERTRE